MGTVGHLTPLVRSRVRNDPKHGVVNRLTFSTTGEGTFRRARPQAMTGNMRRCFRVIEWTQGFFARACKRGQRKRKHIGVCESLPAEFGWSPKMSENRLRGVKPSETTNDSMPGRLQIASGKYKLAARYDKQWM